MKTIYPIIILAGALSSLAPALHGPLGPAEVAIHGAGQNLTSVWISSRTNVVGGITNYTVAFKSTTTNFTLNAGSLLALLENSFNTNFPAGCRLLLAGGPFYSIVVSDASGTNIGFAPNQVLSSSPLSIPIPVVSGIGIDTSTNNPGGKIVSGKATESSTTALTFTYDDSAITNTADGTHTMFKWVGLVHDVSLESANSTNSFFNEIVTMEVLGSGSLHFPTNPPIGETHTAVFTGSIRARVSGSAF